MYASIPVPQRLYYHLNPTNPIQGINWEGGGRLRRGFCPSAGMPASRDRWGVIFREDNCEENGRVIPFFWKGWNCRRGSVQVSWQPRQGRRDKERGVIVSVKLSSWLTNSRTVTANRTISRRHLTQWRCSNLTVMITALDPVLRQLFFSTVRRLII